MQCSKMGKQYGTVAFVNIKFKISIQAACNSGPTLLTQPTSHFIFCCWQGIGGHSHALSPFTGRSDCVSD